jgi:hypothetical protein
VGHIHDILRCYCPAAACCKLQATCLVLDHKEEVVKSCHRAGTPHWLQCFLQSSAPCRNLSGCSGVSLPILKCLLATRLGQASAQSTLMLGSTDCLAWLQHKPRLEADRVLESDECFCGSSHCLTMRSRKSLQDKTLHLVMLAGYNDQVVLMYLCITVTSSFNHDAFWPALACAGECTWFLS